MDEDGSRGWLKDVYKRQKEDLAILKLEDGGSLDLRPVKFGDSDRVKVGELVIAI